MKNIANLKVREDRGLRFLPASETESLSKIEQSKI